MNLYFLKKLLVVFENFLFIFLILAIFATCQNGKTGGKFIRILFLEGSYIEDSETHLFSFISRSTYWEEFPIVGEHIFAFLMESWT